MLKHIISPSPRNIERAAAIIRDGGIVAFPTETVYGLGANAFNAMAVKKIFKAKGRPTDNPLIVHIAEREMLADIVTNIPLDAEKCIRTFWPGPLTLILPKKSSIPKNVTAGHDTVAVRMPNSRIALQLIREARVPIAAPSANRAGRPSPTTAADVAHDLANTVPLILDGGPTRVGLESTVLDLSKKQPVILRPGAITRKDIEKCIGKRIQEHTSRSKAPASPGMKYRHYAPKATLRIIRDRRRIPTTIHALQQQNKHVGVLTTDERKMMYKKHNISVLSLGPANNPERMARNLFRMLRKADEKHIHVLLVEPIPEKGIGKAIMNRLEKAARS